MVPQYTSPLAGYESATPLPTETILDANRNEKFLTNTNHSLSSAYEVFPAPILPKDESNGFDVHIYYMQRSKTETKYAKELHERIRREFPELSISTLKEGPAGPHPVGNFEVDATTPKELGTIMAWLVVNRGPLSVLFHPNTGDSLGDHFERATWIGKPWPLDAEIF